MATLSNGYRFEAEALSLSGYRIESSSTVDAGKYIATKQYSGATGKASGTFAGDDGSYRVEVGYYDENDGKSLATVTVDGQSTSFRFDKDLGSSLPSPDTHATKVTHQSINLKNGDPFSLYGKASGAEYARFDYVDFIRLDPATPPASAPAPTPEPAPAPDNSAGFGDFEAEVARLVNAYRAQNGRNELNLDNRLNLAAEGHSEDMASNNFFSHTGSDGSRVGARVSDEGYDWRGVGENIAAGQTTPQKVFDAWKASSGHNSNMLNASWQDMGVGYVESDASRYDHYWTLDFALA